MYLAVIAAAMMVACNGKKTAQNETKNDSVCVADSVSADVDLAAVAGTYEGTLPAADCPGIKTVLTINADSTYQPSRTTSTVRTDTTRQAACCRFLTAT